MDRKSFYDAIEKVEGGAELLEFAKSEFTQIGGVEKSLRDTKDLLDAANNQLDSFKGIIDVAKSNNLDAEGLKGMIDKSREGETDIQKLTRVVEDLQRDNKTLRTEIADEKASKTKLEEEKINNDLKKKFKEHLGNVIPKILDSELDSMVSKKSIYFDTEGKPVGEIEGKAYDPKRFAEQYTAKNPEFLIKKGGAGSKHTEYKGTDNGWEGERPNNLIGMGLKSRGVIN